MTPSAKDQLEPRELNAFAGVMAWLIPGGGHYFVLGEKRRGLSILVGILFLIITGTLVGGVQAVDSKDQRLWFLAQSCNGPIVFAIDAVNQRFVKSLPDDERDPITAFGRVQEIGILFVALAGLMNLVVVIDALHFRPRGAVVPSTPPRRETTPAPEPAAASADDDSSENAEEDATEDSTDDETTTPGGDSQ